MNINSVGTSGANIVPAASMDQEAMIAVEAVKQSQDDHRTARDARRAQQDETISKMHQAAETLRQIARNSIASAVVAGAAAGASMASAANGLSTGGKATADLSAAQRTTEKAFAVAERAFDAAAKVDPFALKNNFLQADKAGLDAEAESARQRAQDAGDHAQFMQKDVDKTIDQLDKVLEARRRGTDAALRG